MGVLGRVSSFFVVFLIADFSLGASNRLLPMAAFRDWKTQIEWRFTPWNYKVLYETIQGKRPAILGDAVQDGMPLRLFITRHLMEVGYERPVIDGSGSEDIVFEIAGSESPKEIVLIGTSYGGGENGTGITAVLDLAETFKASGVIPKKTLRFVFFENAERYFRRLGEGRNFIRYFFNLDSIGFPDGSQSEVSLDSVPRGSSFFEQVNAQFKLGLQLRSQRKRFAPNRSAELLGIPTALVFESVRNEPAQELNLNYATTVTRFAAAGAYAMASEPPALCTHEVIVVD